MKFLSLIAASFAACLAFSLPAHAATIDLSTLSDPTAFPDTYASRTVSASGNMTWDNVAGYLAPHTSIMISYTGTSPYKMILNASGVDENVNWIVSGVASRNDAGGFKITSSQTSTQARQFL